MRFSAGARRLLPAALSLFLLVGTSGEEWESCSVCRDENGVSKITVPAETIAIDVPMGHELPRFPQATCGDLLDLEPNESCNCDCMRLAAAVRCGCGEAPTDIECPLCHDGSIPASLNEELEALDELDMPGMTCFDLLLGAAMAPSQDEGNCTATQDLGSMLCGCPLPPDVTDDFCSLCPDGTTVADGTEMSVVYGVDCTVMELAALDLKPDTDECTAFQATAGLYCGCTKYDPSTEDPSKVCRICGDNTPLPQPHLPSGKETYTCGAVEIEANSLQDNPDPEEVEEFGNCDSLRDEFGVSCCDVPADKGNCRDAQGTGCPEKIGKEEKRCKRKAERITKKYASCLVDALLSQQICDDGHICENGSKCVEVSTGAFLCDCEASPIAVKGLRCEHKATSFCKVNQSTTPFCTNGGICSEISDDDMHEACLCPENYEGKHCEFFSGTSPEDWGDLEKELQEKGHNADGAAVADQVCRKRLERKYRKLRRRGACKKSIQSANRTFNKIQKCVEMGYGAANCVEEGAES